MRLIGEGPAARDAWARAATADIAASQTPPWLDAACEAGGLRDVTRLYAAQDGRELVLPLARPARAPAMLALPASLPPAWGVGGLLGADGAVTGQDVRDVLADLAGAQAISVRVRPGPSSEEMWAAWSGPEIVRMPRMTQVLTLGGGFEHVWTDRFSSKVRRWCRRAERGSLEVESDATGRLMDVFGQLYELSVKRWAEQQHEPLALAQWRAARRDPPRKFTAVARHLGEECRVWVARRDGEAAAAIIVLRHGRRATYWRGAMDKEVAAKTGANELLHRLAIEEACEDGVESYDLGDSAAGSSLARFKASFGATERWHAEYRVERLPLTAIDRVARGAVKRALRFRDA